MGDERPRLIFVRPSDSEAIGRFESALFGAARSHDVALQSVDVPRLSLVPSAPRFPGSGRVDGRLVYWDFDRSPLQTTNLAEVPTVLLTDLAMPPSTHAALQRSGLVIGAVRGGVLGTSTTEEANEALVQLLTLIQGPLDETEDSSNGPTERPAPVSPYVLVRQLEVLTAEIDKHTEWHDWQHPSAERTALEDELADVFQQRDDLLDGRALAQAEIDRLTALAAVLTAERNGLEEEINAKARRISELGDRVLEQEVELERLRQSLDPNRLERILMGVELVVGLATLAATILTPVLLAADSCQSTVINLLPPQ